nr:diguanylate cyclase [Marinobacterium ramblicola]
MTATVRDANGQHLAYLVGLSALDRSGFLNPLYSTHAASAAELILILPGDNLSLGADGGSLTLTPLPESGTDRSNTNTEAETLDVAVPVPGSRWELIARLPTVEVYRPQTELRRFILHNTGFLALIALVLLTLGIRYLLGPLRHAAEHADKMTLNEIPLAPLPVVRDDEVGHLTQAFNRVLDKLIESQAELQHMAHRDPLTGLPNRHLLADRMTQALARAQRNQTWVAVLFLDLDRFKPINDRLGHDAGDQALQQVAARLQGALRRVDTLARVGGDEFVILLTDLGQDAKTATQAVAQKCLDTFDQEFTIKGEPCRLGTSIGIALGDGDCAPDKLLISADQAMYESKLSGCGEIRRSVAEAENLPMLQANLNHEHFD